VNSNPGAFWQVSTASHTSHHYTPDGVELRPVLTARHRAESLGTSLFASSADARFNAPSLYFLNAHY
jgi:hypothetical protein